MLAQGSAILNTQYFASLENRVNNTTSCSELQSLTSNAMESIQANVSAINSELAVIQPILSLLEAPSANPSAIVTWIETFITSFLTPYTKPTVTYAAQLAAISSQMTSLVSAISSKAASFESCTVTPPTITGL